MNLRTLFLHCSCLLAGLFAFPSFHAVAHATEKLVVISPHRKSIQDEFIPLFEKYYKEKFQSDIQVEWIDQGGTENNLRYVSAKYKANPSSSGIDLFWGGGDVVFTDLENDGLLEAFPLSEPLRTMIPARAAGVDLYSKNHKWYATALSSFGIFYNKALLTRLKLPEPTTWEDLARPEYQNLISIADPRHSATSLFMQMLVLYSEGWEKGWKVLSALAANTRNFTHSSSDPIKAVVSGDAAIATAIDFYSYAKIAELGSSSLGFVLPAGKTVVNADPIAILKGATNKLQAQRFVEFILSPEAQKIFILPKGDKNGPKFSDLGRMAVNPLAYSTLGASQKAVTANPFNMTEPNFQIDVAKLSKLNGVYSDLLGAIQVDNHHSFKTTWNLLQKTKGSETLLNEFVAPPLSEKQVLELANKWDDNVFRNKTINEWIGAAKEKNERIARELANLAVAKK